MEDNTNNGCGENCKCKTDEKDSSCSEKCSCKETISGLKSQLSESTDKYLRTYADFENFKKRVQKEKEDIKDNTKISIMSSIFDIDSDLSIALKNIKDKEARDGVNLIISKMEKFLRSHSIESIQTDVYDPHMHEVVTIIKPDGKNVVDVISKGYTVNGKPFRYPKIVLG